MKHILFHFAFTFSVFNLQAEFKTPTFGNWIGQESGRVIVEKTYSLSPEASKPHFMKRILMGEATTGMVIVFSSPLDKEQFTISPKALTKNHLSDLSKLKKETITFNNQTIPVLSYLRESTKGSLKTFREEKVLASQPSIMLYQKLHTLDKINDLQSERLFEMKLIDIEMVEFQGKTYQAFVTEKKWIQDGVLRSKTKETKIEILPGGILKSERSQIDASGNVIRTYVKEITKAGYDMILRDQLKHHQVVLALSPKSMNQDDFEINQHLFLQRGFSQAFIKQQKSNMFHNKVLKQLKQRSAILNKLIHDDMIKPAKKEEMLTVLKINDVKNQWEIKHSNLEKAYIKILNSEDHDLKTWALINLVKMSSFDYAKQLEDYLISNNLYHVEAIDCLEKSLYGNPDRVAQSLKVKLAKVKFYHLKFFDHDSSAVELIERYHKADRVHKKEIAKEFIYNSSTKLKTFLIQLSDQLVKDDFALNRTDQSYSTKFIIKAMVYCCPEEAIQRFPKWLTWMDDHMLKQSKKYNFESGVSVIDRERLILYAVKLYDSKTDIWIGKNIKKVLEFPRFFGDRDYLEKFGLLRIKINLNETELRALEQEYQRMKRSGRLGISKSFAEMQSVYVNDRSKKSLFKYLNAIFPGSNFDNIKTFIEHSELYKKPWLLAKKGIKIDVNHANLTTRHLNGDQFSWITDFESCDEVLLEMIKNEIYVESALKQVIKIKGNQEQILKAIQDIEYSPHQSRNDLKELALWIHGAPMENEKFIDQLQSPYNKDPSVYKNSLRYLPFTKLKEIVEERIKAKPPKHLRETLLKALSFYKTKESAELMFKLAFEENQKSLSYLYSEAFNQMAGKHFGNDQDKIRKWISDLE